MLGTADYVMHSAIWKVSQRLDYSQSTLMTDRKVYLKKQRLVFEDFNPYDLSKIPQECLLLGWLCIPGFWETPGESREFARMH